MVLFLKGEGRKRSKKKKKPKLRLSLRIQIVEPSEQMFVMYATVVALENDKEANLVCEKAFKC